MNSASPWLLLRFAQREVTNRFAGSLLGGVWALLHPLALLLIFSFVFTTVLKVRVPYDSPVPYVVFLAVGLWPWLAFQDAVSRATVSVVANGALVKKVAFAHELVVHAAVAASFAVQLTGFGLVLAYLAAAGHEVHFAGIGLLAFCLLALALLATGLGLLFGALQVFVRDIEQGLTHVLGMLFYLSPIIYSATMLPDWLKGYLLVNPVAVLIEATREALLQGRAAPMSAEWIAAGFSLAVALLGRVVFRRLSPHFEEAL